MTDTTKLESELAGWRERLADVETELAAIPAKRQALEAQRDNHLLAARVDHDTEAEAAVEAARSGLFVLDDKEEEAQVLIDQIQEKIAGLEAEKLALEKQGLIAELHAALPGRKSLDEDVERNTATLVQSLVDLLELGNSMARTSKRLFGLEFGLDGAAIFLAEDAALNFVLGQLSAIFPGLGGGFGVQSLVAGDTERIRAFLERKLQEK